MASSISVLMVVIDPAYLDFTTPEFLAMPGISAEKINAGINGSVDELNKLGYDTEACWIDTGATAISVMQAHLKTKHFDLVLIGAGIRKLESSFLLFEQMINAIHEASPASKICFNTNPMDSTEAVKRWVS